MTDQTTQPFLIIDHNGTKRDFARKICVGIARSVFIAISQLVAIMPYVLFGLLFRPIKIVSPNLYWTIEGIAYRGLLLMAGSWQWSAGYTGKSLFDFCLCNGKH